MSRRGRGFFSILRGLAVGLFVAAVLVGFIVGVTVYERAAGELVLFAIALTVAFFCGLAPLYWVYYRLDDDDVEPPLVFGFGIPIFLFLGFMFVLGASAVTPKFPQLAGPFICPDGYPTLNLSFTTRNVPGRGDLGSFTKLDLDRLNCSGEQGRFRPGGYTYPLVMVGGYMILALMLMLAAEADNAFLSGRIPSHWRLRLLLLFRDWIDSGDGVSTAAGAPTRPPAATGHPLAVTTQNQMTLQQFPAHFEVPRHP